jgi:hypothetical protein
VNDSFSEILPFALSLAFPQFDCAAKGANSPTIKKYRDRLACQSRTVSLQLSSYLPSKTTSFLAIGRASLAHVCAVVRPCYFTNSISPGRQVLLIQGSSGPYMRRAANQPLPGIVSSQLFSKPFGGLGAK